MDKKPKQRTPKGASAAEVTSVINSIVGLLPGVLGIIQLFRSPRQQTTWSKPYDVTERYIPNGSKLTPEELFSEMLAHKQDIDDRSSSK